MAAIVKLPSGSWRAQVRRKGKYISRLTILSCTLSFYSIDKLPMSRKTAPDIDFYEAPGRVNTLQVTVGWP